MVVKQVIKEKGFTIAKVAEQMNISRVTLHQLLSRDSITTQTLHRIADVIGCQIGDFFTDEISALPSQPTHVCPHCGQPIKICVSIE